MEIERNNQAEADCRTIDGGQNRLFDSEEIRIFLLEIRRNTVALEGVATQSRYGVALPAGQALGRDGTEQRHVGASAKAASCAGQHDDADVVIALGLAAAGAHFLFHGGRPGIELVGTVQRDGCDSICDFVDRFLGWHAQNVKRTPSWIWRLGTAEVNASGGLGVAVPPPASAVPGRIPCTLNEVLPSPTQGAVVGSANSGFTSLFTLAKFVRFAMLNPSAVNCRLAFSPSLCRQVKRASKSLKPGRSLG